MKVVILGKGLMLANLIEGVKESGSHIVGILRHERISLPCWKLFLQDCFKNSPEYTLIKKYKLKEINSKSANSKQFKDKILKLNPDIILVGTWSEKLKKEIINLPKIATINVHPALLPKYRGPNPYLQTILHGEKESGITFHLMDENFDSGAILMQKKIKILSTDTSKELRERTTTYARFMVKKLINSFENGFIEPITQNEKEATYYKNISGDEKMLNFKKQTSVEIFNTVRALHPFLPAYITVSNGFLIVNPYKIKIVNLKGEAGQVVSKDNKMTTMTIACKDNVCVKFEGLRRYKNFGFTT